MPRKPLARTRPGFSPAAGFPDPQAPPPPTFAQANVSHMPHANGTVCGLKLTHAGAYTTDRPTCPKCQAYYDAVQATSRYQRSALPPGALGDVPREPQTSPDDDNP